MILARGCPAATLHHRIATTPRRCIPTSLASLHHRITASPHHRITASLHHSITASPHQCINETAQE
ncbi:hypothetical protein K6W77_28995, partial [Burkholderia cepacia]|nr:hypothetical protein [Burkholderia cepacia]